MSYNPAFDPRSDKDGQNRQQQQSDQQYVREVAGNRANYAAQPVYSQTAQPVYTTSAPVTRNVTEVNTYDAVEPRDRVRWGPILAGLVSALSTLVVLSLLGAAVGLTAATGDPAGGANAAANRNQNYALGAGIWAAISALISFFVGGLIAGRTAGIRGKGNGWINGALVWAVALPLLLWLASSGATGFLNAIGFDLNSFFGQAQATVNNPATNPANNPGAVQQAAETTRNGLWGTLAALLLGLMAAGLGGLVGSRSHKDEFDANDGVPTRQS